LFTSILKKERVFLVSTIDQFLGYLTVQNTVTDVIGGIIKTLESKDNRRGIPLFQKVTKGYGGVEILKIKNLKGEDVLKVSNGFTGRSLETDTLKVHVYDNNKVIISEPTLGIETQYTNKGKLLEQTKPLVPIAKDEGGVIVEKILKNIFEETLPHMSLKDKGFVSRFENAVRSNIQKTADARKIIEAQRLG